SGPAALVGLAEEIGTIEQGKRADLVFFDGDPLRVGTRATRAMVGGKLVWEEAADGHE
ncbi:MAG: amidohydrolase family protein, partial [Planctomycetes bacterium]|nr:amidohydrolase family protein [Planctomycetota bacterium]